MYTFKKHDVQAMLVVMIVSSCPTAQAIDWDHWSEYAGDKAQQVANQIKKPKVRVPLMAVAAAVIGGYIYLRNQALEMVKAANNLLNDVDNRHDVSEPGNTFQSVTVDTLLNDIESLESSIKGLEDWKYRFVGPYGTTLAQLKQRKGALEGFISDDEADSNCGISEDESSHGRISGIN